MKNNIIKSLTLWLSLTSILASAGAHSLFTDAQRAEVIYTTLDNIVIEDNRMENAEYSADNDEDNIEYLESILFPLVSEIEIEFLRYGVNLSSEFYSMYQLTMSQPQIFQDYLNNDEKMRKELIRISNAARWALKPIKHLLSSRLDSEKTAFDYCIEYNQLIQKKIENLKLEMAKAEQVNLENNQAKIESDITNNCFTPNMQKILQAIKNNPDIIDFYARQSRA